MKDRSEHLKILVAAFWPPVLVFFCLIVSGVLFVSGFSSFAQVLLLAVTLVGALPYAYRFLRDMIRGHFGVDMIALGAMIGAALLGEGWAGAIILLMLAGGEGLEIYALKRARKQLEALFSRAPLTAHVRRGNQVMDVPVEAVQPEEALVIKPGELIPVDAMVVSGFSLVDESTLTGEPLPVDKNPHSRLLGGSFNQTGLLEARALTGSVDSQYGRMVRLIREAEDKKAPIVRLADTWSGWFTLVTFFLAGGAWIYFDDPIRALAVLVVATPCPLLLATPIAIMSGISRAAGEGIIVKHGGALEILARARSMVFDKTGTLTFGVPTIRETVGFTLPAGDVLRLAASLDQGSAHILARALVAHAQKQGAALSFPEQFEERLGNGVRGLIDRIPYVLGKLAFITEAGVDVPEAVRQSHEAGREQGVRAIYLGRGKALLGWIEFADLPRSGLKELFQALRFQGIETLEMLTGDKAAVAKELARGLGLKKIKAECLPEDKVQEVKLLLRESAPVVMIGDGINDAPALATASVGIAMSAHGASVTSEAADIVITTDDVKKVLKVLLVAKRSIRIALQGIWLGMGLSFCLMVLAFLGFIPPVTGALLQEVVDVLVILNALKASVAGRKEKNAEGTV